MIDNRIKPSPPHPLLPHGEGGHLKVPLPEGEGFRVRAYCALLLIVLLAVGCEPINPAALISRALTLS